MKRRLFNVACGLSLLIWLLVLALWFRSQGHFSSTIWSRPNFYASTWSEEGELNVEATRDSTDRPPANGGLYGWFHFRGALPASRHVPSLFALQILKTVAPPEGMFRIEGRRLVSASAPFWFLAGMAGALPLLWLGLLLERRMRAPSGCCAACGYNLTGNTTGVCSECGAAVAEARVRLQHRSRRMRLVPLGVASVVLLPFAGRTAVDQFHHHAEWKKMLARQAAYLEYSAPPSRVVYVEDPLAAAKLLAADPNYLRIGTSACYATKLDDRVPGLHLTRNGGPILFMHGRRSRGGISRLVSVGIMSLDDYEDLCVEEFVPASADVSQPYSSRESDLAIRRWPDQHLTFLAGQPDPTDPSHFTIGYRLDDQPGTIEGWLLDDGAVKLQVRDGPAITLAASPTPLKFRFKWGGTPPARGKP